MPFSAFQISGTRPATEKDASIVAAFLLSKATKYQSVPLSRRWIQPTRLADASKSFATPMRPSASSAPHSMTPCAHTRSTRDAYASSAMDCTPACPGTRVGRLTAQTFAPALTSSPIFRTILSLIVSVSGKTRSVYSAPPGVTSLQSLTVRHSMIFVSHTSHQCPFGASFGCFARFGVSSPHQ